MLRQETFLTNSESLMPGFSCKSFILVSLPVGSVQDTSPKDRHIVACSAVQNLHSTQSTQTVHQLYEVQDLICCNDHTVPTK